MTEYFQKQIDFYNSGTPTKSSPLLFCLLCVDNGFEMKPIKLSELSEELFVGYEFSQWASPDNQFLPVFKPIVNEADKV